MHNLGTLGQFFGWAWTRPSVDEQLEKESLVGPPVLATPLTKPRLLKTSEILAAYGKPGDPDNLTTITLVSYPFYLDWDLKTPITRVTVHKKIAAPLLAVFKDILAYYGLARIKELRIDQFSGCFNFRPMRGLESKYAAAVKAGNTALAATYLSRHSWAIAGDWDGDQNQLKWKANKAQFAKPEYKKMIEIFYKHGFISYGVERGSDWMHFEIGVIL